MGMIFTPPRIYDSARWSNKRIGLLGGSFNPAHEGHLHISYEALKRLNLDAVWWLVSPQNPLKSRKNMAVFQKRLDKARDVARHPKIIVTDIERQMGTRYTVDTIEALQRHFCNTNFVWLMGADNLLQFHLWHGWQEIFQRLPIAVLNRPPIKDALRQCKAAETYRANYCAEQKAGHELFVTLPSWTILHIPLNGLSSTSIRKKTNWIS